MDWRCTAAILIGVTVGCQSERPGLVGVEGGRPPLPTGLMEMKDTSPASPTSRSQKPDPVEEKPVEPASFLDRTAATTADGQVVAAIRATVNGVPILENEVRSACFERLQQTQGLSDAEREAKQQEILDKTLDVLIERELVLQEANARFGGKNQARFMDKLKEAADKEFDRQIVRALKAQAGIKNDEEFKRRLKAQGASLEGLRKQFERQFIYQEYLRFRAEPALVHIGHEQLRDYYDGHPEEFQAVDSVDWQDLFVAASRYPSREAARQLAEDLRDRVSRGENFAQLVKDHDNGDASYRNGEGFGHKRGEINPPEAEGVLFSLKEGDVGPLIELTNGYHVIRLVKRQYAGKLSFDAKTQQKVREKLRSDAFTREAKKVVAELKRKATIEIAGKQPSGEPEK